LSIPRRAVLFAASAIGAVAVAAVVLVVVGELADESPAPPRIPASMTRPEDRDVARYQQIVRERVAAGEPLSPRLSPLTVSPRIAEELGLVAGDTVVDVGCGTGALEVMLLESGQPFERIHALDLDCAAVEFLAFMLAEGRLDPGERISPRCVSGTDVELAAGSVDVAILINTPLYQESPGDPPDGGSNSQALASIRRALKPGGRLHVIEGETTFHERGGDDPCEPAPRRLTEQGFRRTRCQLLPYREDPRDPSRLLSMVFVVDGR
jgi:SAM-dependent methyltransferase